MAFYKKIGALTSKPYAFTARPWELRSTFTYDLFDSIGSNIRVDSRGASVLRIVPHVNENLNENWISDKVRFFYDGLRRQRLLSPMVGPRPGSLAAVSWPSLFASLKGPKSFGDSDFLGLRTPTNVDLVPSADFLFGSFSDFKTLKSITSLAKGLKLPQVSLTPSSHLRGHSDFRDYLFESSLGSLERSDFCLLVACNPRLESPILNIRLRRSVQSRSLRVASLGFFPATTYRVHSLGNSLSKLLHAMEGKSNLSLLLQKSSAPAVILGETFFSSVQSSLIESFIHLMHLRTKAAVNTLSSKVANLSFLEFGLGFSRAPVSKNFLKAMDKAKPLLWLNEVDHCDFFAASTLISNHHHGDATVSRSSYVVPGCTYFEKHGIYLNGFGKSLPTPFIHNPPAGARAQWKTLQNFDSFLNLSHGSKASALDPLPTPCAPSPRSPLYSELTRQAPLSKINYISTSSVFHFFLEDFYMSDSITRNSPVMALASSRFRGFKSNFLD